MKDNQIINTSIEAFSEENLIKLLDSKDRQLVAAAETVLGVCKYPDNYWVMPDYYYPGLESKSSSFPLYDGLSEKERLLLDATSNDYILMAQRFLQEKKGVFTKITPKDASSGVHSVNFNETEELINLENERGEIVEIPWPLLCGIFLKARELGFSKPDVLDKAGPATHKDKWLVNQEKIKELQSKIEY